LKPRATNTGTPDGVLLCFVNDVLVLACFDIPCPGVETPRYKHWDSWRSPIMFC